MRLGAQDLGTGSLLGKIWPWPSSLHLTTSRLRDHLPRCCMHLELLALSVVPTSAGFFAAGGLALMCCCSLISGLTGALRLIRLRRLQFWRDPSLAIRDDGVARWMSMVEAHGVDYAADSYFGARGVRCNPKF